MRDMLADKVVAMKPSGIRKFFDIVNEMEDAISLGVGEPDFETPWHIRDEGIYSLEQGRTFYTSNAGLKELREEVCNTIERRKARSAKHADHRQQMDHRHHQKHDRDRVTHRFLAEVGGSKGGMRPGCTDRRQARTRSPGCIGVEARKPNHSSAAMNSTPTVCSSK